MTAIAPVRAQVSRVAPAVEPVSLERAVIPSSPPNFVPEMATIGAQGGSIALTLVAPDRSTVVHESAAITPQVAPMVTHVVRVRPDVAAI